MRAFLKQHPWQLEIVPFLIALIASIVPLMHWQQMLAHTQPLPGLSVSATWLLRYVARVWIAFTLFVGGWQTNQQWALSEREKRYNFWAVLAIIIIGLFGWFASEWMLRSFWLAVTILAAVLQAIIEWRRPFVLLQHPNPMDSAATDVQPGDRFYYREGTSIARTTLLSTAGALVCMLAFVRHWESLIMALVVMAASSTIAIMRGHRREIVITRDKITGVFGAVRLLIPMAEVSSCTIADPHPLTESFRGHRGWGHTWDGMQLYGECTGPMLRIDTAEGKTYLLGIKKPETARKLILSAISRPS